MCLAMAVSLDGFETPLCSPSVFAQLNSSDVNCLCGRPECNKQSKQSTYSGGNSLE